MMMNDNQEMGKNRSSRTREPEKMHTLTEKNSRGEKIPMQENDMSDQDPREELADLLVDYEAWVKVLQKKLRKEHEAKNKKS